MKRTGAQIIWEVLAREGTDVVFGYPGGAIMPAYDAMLDYPVRHVLVRHEQGAAHMADGYARASGKVGVAMATSGPGALNLVTGIATAMMDSSPIVCITGQVAAPLLGTDAFQETDITGVTLPITKHNYLVTAADEIAPTLHEAFFVARSGRPGPVVVDITKDAQQASIDFEFDDKPVQLAGYRSPTEVLPSAMKRALAMIDQAERPLILAGRGVVESAAGSELVEFVDKAKIPVASTLLGLGGFPAQHPLALGMMGMHGEAWVNHAIQEADVLIALGMRFDDRVTGKVATYAPNAYKIHVDIDASEINKVVKVDVPIVADVRQTLAAWNGEVEASKREKWVTRMQELRKAHSEHDVQQAEDGGRLLAAHVVNDLWRLTEGKALLVTDVGQNQMWAAQYYHQSQPRHMVTSGGLGTMGFALPAAIGARFARPDAEVWAIAGDGGFQMTAAELTTCAQEGVKLNVAILNNGYLGMVRQWQEFFYDKRYAATPMKSPDFVKLVEAHGLTALRVTKREEVADAVAKAQQTPGTVVIEFVVEQEDSVYPMVAAGADLDQMIRRPESKVADGSPK